MPILHIVLFEFKPVTTHAQVEDARARLTAQHQHQLTFLTGLQTHDRPGGQMHAPNPQRTLHEIARRRPRQQPRRPAGSSYPHLRGFDEE